MKKIISHLILGTLLLIGMYGFSQTSITYRFNNLKIVPGVTYDTLYFDVEAKGSAGTTYTTGFNLKINFNSAVFGASAVPVYAEKLILTQPTGYNFNTLFISVNSTRFGATFTANRLLPPFSGTYETSLLSNLTTEYQGVVRYKMLITGSGNCGLEFYVSGSGSMSSGNHYVLTSGGTATTNYTPVIAGNTLLTLPSDPNTSLIISEVGDPSNSTTNFVEIYNAGATSLDLTNHYPWFLNINASSSVQLTGTLAAGGKYTVAYDNTDFTPNLVSTNVGTGGTSNYSLSTYGNYTSGTLIDVYNGTLTGFDYTGKHAVRHFSVVTPTTTPALSEWVISAALNTDMTPGSHRSTLTWDGVPSSEWRLKANWAEGFIPDAGHNVALPAAGAVPVISNGDNAYANNLAITGSLIIESDETNGDGSLITFGTVTGTANVQRFLGADRYWYVTQPVSSATANVFLHTWMFTYNEAGSAWTPFIEDETTPLSLMKGYAVWTSSVNSWNGGPAIGDTTVAYSGTLNSGSVSTGLTKGGDGWNFVGNPYVSAVDWEATGWTKTNLSTDAYGVWNGATYSTYTAGGGSTNGGTRYIPAGQGFFVNASAAGTLGVTNAVRTHSTQDFWKSDENRMNRLSLTISNGDVNDETVIYFHQDASPELDYSFDAKKLMAEASPQAYTLMGTEKMAINTLNNTTQTPTVVLGISAPAEGEYTITASNIESFDASTPILLEDIATGQKISLREMSTYTFSAGEGTSERFVVHFAEYQGIGDKPSSDITNIYAGNRVINVDFEAVKGEIVIYDILGQEISRTAASNGLNKVSVPKGNAVYVVKVISDNSAVTKKVFVK